MITISPEKLYKLIISHNINGLKITDIDGNQIFVSWNESPTNSSPQRVVEEVKDFLKDFPKDNILICEGREAIKTHMTKLLIWHVIDKSEPNAEPNEKPVIRQGFTLDDVNAQIRKALEDHESKRQIDELRKQAIELKKEYEIKHKEIAGWAGKASIGAGIIVENLLKNTKLGSILNGIGNTSPGQSSNINSEEMLHDLPPEEIEKVEKSVDKLLEVFSPDEFEQISNAIAQNPDKKALILSFMTK